MKDDYLWDKTGEDAEIEALENALTAFRFQENAPPALPQTVLTVERRDWRKVFRFGFPAFAALASLAIVFSLVWFALTGGGKIPAAGIAAKTTELEKAEKSAQDTVIEQRDLLPQPIQSAPPLLKTRSVKVIQKRVPPLRPLKAFQRKPKLKEPAETLTAEERYAYNQLMLALSITGTQLKIVRDKVQGIEEQNAVVETEK